jgi:anaerobic ribonucleoside-triphosphate reductase
MTNKIPFQIRKRDGRVVKYKRERITTAIFKSAENVGGHDRKRAEEIAKIVEKKLLQKYGKRKYIKTSEIADIVKSTLLEQGHGKTAASYALFVDLKNKIKNIKSLIDADSLVNDYISEADWRVKENSNMAYSWQGLNNHISTTVQSNYWLHSIYPKEIANAHIKADMHIHNLGMLTTYCCGWSLEDLLLKGFTGVPGKVSCAPPNHFGTALGQCVNFMYTLQHEAAGAQAFSNFDTYLAPFIRYDNLTYKEVKQKVQEFVFNMNVPTRVGCQAPFTNITLDLVPTGQLANQNVIIGGNLQKEKYKDFQKEMNMFNRAFAEVMSAGDASGRVFTWPIPTYNITKEFDWDNKSIKPVWEMTAKYGIPYFANFVNSDMKPDDARSMCCRLRIDYRELKKRGGGLFGSNPLTGSIGVVTINLPRIGYLAKDKKDFYKRLDHITDLAKESLIIKRNKIEKFTEIGLYPYSKFYMADIKKRYGKYWKNHFNTIGILGMNEALLNFMKKDITTEEGREFGLEIMDHLRKRLQEYQKETGYLFNLEASPGEGTTYRFAKNDKKEFPDIITAADIGKRKGKKNVDPYYTNSSQLPVGKTDDLVEALDMQDTFQTKYTGGTVLHIFLGEKMPSAEATKKLVKKIAENYELPYFSITPTFSICPKHGYIPGEHEFCPFCDQENGYHDGKPYIAVD